MSEFEQTGSENGDVAESDDVVARVLASAGAASANRTSFGAASDQIERAQALQSDSNYDERRDGEQLDREDRQALRRVAGLSTELDDVTEVEYRQLRLENVVLIGEIGRAHV